MSVRPGHQTTRPPAAPGDRPLRLGEALRWYASTWSAQWSEWRGVLGLGGFGAALVCLQVALTSGGGQGVPTPSRGAALAAHPGLTAGALFGLAVWFWATSWRALRTGRDGPWPLALARWLVLATAFLVTTGPGWPGPGNERYVWAGAIGAELLLGFRRSRAWASAAAVGAGVMAWLIWG